MAKQFNNTGAMATLFELYEYLDTTIRTEEEDIIFNKIKERHQNQFENSTVYFYKLNKDRAKVKFTTFSTRCFNGWDKEKALTTAPLQKKKPVVTKKEDEIKRKKLQNEETEQDIIRFVENGLVLNRRQLKYIESNPAFAEKLKNRKVEC